MRLFIAVDLSESVRDELALAAKAKRALSPDARWSRAENLHVTLVFLGATSEDLVPRIERTMVEVGKRHAPLSLSVAGADTFGPSRRPRVVFASIEGDLEPLGLLQLDLAAELEPLGFTQEARDYRPHITLARARDPRGDSGLAKLKEEIAALRAPPTEIAELVLYRSSPDATGSRYTAIFSAPLALQSKD